MKFRAFFWMGSSLYFSNMQKLQLHKSFKWLFTALKWKRESLFNCIKLYETDSIPLRTTLSWKSLARLFYRG